MAFSTALAENWQSFELWVNPGRNGHQFSLLGPDLIGASAAHFGLADYNGLATHLSIWADVDLGVAISDDTNGDFFHMQTGAFNDPDQRLVQWFREDGSTGVPSASDRQFFLIGEGRATHGFLLEQPGGAFYLAQVGSVVPGTANLPGGPRRELSSLFDPSAADFWILDLTTLQRSSSHTLDLALASWVPYTAPLPTRYFRFFLDGQETGRTFTLHSRSPGGSEQLQSVIAEPLNSFTLYSDVGYFDEEGTLYTMDHLYGPITVPNGSASFEGQIGLGMEFWLTRDADGAASPRRLVAPSGAPHASLLGAFPPLPPPTTRVPVRVPDPSETWLAYCYAPDGNGTYLDDSFPITPENWTTLYSYDDSGQVDFTLQVISGYVEIPLGASVAFLYTTDGMNQVAGTDAVVWTPTHEQPPELLPGTLVLEVFGGRKDHQFFLEQPDSLGNWQTFFSFTPGDPAWQIGDGWTTVSYTNDFGAQVTVNVGNYVADNQYAWFQDAENLLYEISRVTIAYNSNRPFRIRDVTTGETAPEGVTNLGRWFPPQSGKSLKLSSSRWGHDLWLVHPDGSESQVVQNATQGSIQLTASGASWWTDYYWFDASVPWHGFLPWRLEDRTDGAFTPFHPPGATPDFVNWIAVTAPHGLTAHYVARTSTKPAGILVQWTPGEPPTGGGFIIERRKSKTAFGPYTHWHELDRVGDDSTSYFDTRLLPGQFAIYRVRAFFGDRRSAPSNLYLATMWRLRDGILQPPIGAPSGGSGPTSDPPGGDGGSGGNAGIPGDGDGDGDPDNDSDGVVDTDDRYPDDENRSEDIPVKFYGVIDLSQYQYQGQPLPQGTLSHVAIDDKNRVSWMVQGEPVTTTSGNIHSPGGMTSETITKTNIPTFADGTITNVAEVQRYYWKWTFQDEDAPPPNISYDEFFEDFQFNGLLGSGQPFGSHHVSSGGSKYYRGFPGEHRVPNALLLPDMLATSVPDDWAPWEDDVQGAVGMSATAYLRADPELELPEIMAGDLNYVARPSGGDEYRRITFRRRGGVQEYFPDKRARPGPLSRSSLVVTVPEEPFAVPPVLPRTFVWKNDGTQIQPAIPVSVPLDTRTTPPVRLSLDPKAINDSNQLVGAIRNAWEDPEVEITDPNVPSGKRTGRGYFGFYWNPDEETNIKVFHDLLPGKFRKQLRSAVPFLITNEDPATNITKITFSAESWEGEGESGAWKPRTGSMEMTAASGGQPAKTFVRLMDTLRPRADDGSAEGDPPAISPAGRNIKDVMVQGTPMTTPEGEIIIPLLSEVEVLVKKNRNLLDPFPAGPEWPSYQQTDFQGLRIGTLSHSFSGLTPAADCIVLDADQFIVKVSLPDKKGIAGGKVSAWISTKSPPNPLGPRTMWDDDETEIEMIEKPGGSGIFYSARQMLVADDVDDKAAVQAVWEGGPTINIAQNADNIKNDPTHKIALGGWVYLKLPDRPTAGAIAQVPIEKVVKVEPVILRGGSGGFVVAVNTIRGLLSRY